MAADTMTYDPFEPFAGPGTNSPPPSDRWMPILPAPHPLPASIRHGRYGTPSEVWQYLDPGGSLLYAVCRFDPPDSKKEILPFSCGADDWRSKAPPQPRPLYGLARLAARPSAPVLVVEGEKAAEAARAVFPEVVVISWHGGAHAVAKADWTPLRERKVAVWPDADGPGRKAAADVVK